MVPPVEGGVLNIEFQLLEILVQRVIDDSLVLHRIREGKGLKYSRGVLPHAVLIGLDAVLAVHNRVFPAEKGWKLLFIVVFLPFPSAEALVPGVELDFCYFGGVLEVQRVQSVQFEAVPGSQH